jgi:hypothetical protein
MQDEQNSTADQDPRQLIRDVTDTLGAIVGALRQGNPVPRELIERGEQVWAALDQHPMEDSGPQALLMEGEGNLERTILYRLEHGEPVDAATLDAAEKWLGEARQQSGG